MRFTVRFRGGPLRGPSRIRSRRPVNLRRGYRRRWRSRRVRSRHARFLRRVTLWRVTERWLWGRGRLKGWEPCSVGFREGSKGLGSGKFEVGMGMRAWTVGCVRWVFFKKNLNIWAWVSRHCTGLAEGSASFECLNIEVAWATLSFSGRQWAFSHGPLQMKENWCGQVADLTLMAAFSFWYAALGPV